MERKMKEGIKEVERDLKGSERRKKRGLWDGERDEKKEVRRKLRRWRRNGGKKGKKY